MAKIRKKVQISKPVRSDMITIYNGNRVVLEGVEGIIFCDSEKMIVKNRFLIQIEGEEMRLAELGNDNVAISGRICSLCFLEEKR